MQALRHERAAPAASRAGPAGCAALLHPLLGPRPRPRQAAASAWTSFATASRPSSPSAAPAAGCTRPPRAPAPWTSKFTCEGRCMLHAEHAEHARWGGRRTRDERAVRAWVRTRAWASPLCCRVDTGMTCRREWRMIRWAGMTWNQKGKPAAQTGEEPAAHGQAGVPLTRSSSPPRRSPNPFAAGLLCGVAGPRRQLHRLPALPGAVPALLGAHVCRAWRPVPPPTCLALPPLRVGGRAVVPAKGGAAQGSAALSCCPPPPQVRTEDPSEANLFFIPGFTYSYSGGGWG